VLRTRTSPRLSAASVHSAVIQGGSGISTYAVECRLGVERRTLPSEVPDDVFGEIVDVVHRACPDAEVTLQFQRYPMQTPEDSLLVRSLGTAIERRLGRAMELQGAAGWGDTAVFSGAGIPAVEFGCIGEGAHAQVEWVDFDSVVDVAALAVDAAELIDQTA
jgi:acetylornithine deacetylase